MVYDGDGTRVAKTSGGVTTEYLVDDLNPTGLPQVAEEVVGGGVARRYTYGINRISQTQAGVTSLYDYDAHGDVRALMSTAPVAPGNFATPTDTYGYDAFGNLIGSTGTTPNVYRYQSGRSGSRGKNDSCSSARQRIASIASSKEGSLDSLVNKAKGNYKAGSDKCNEFVADTIQEAGLPRPQVPYTGWRGGFGSRDPDANEWANPKIAIPGWSSPLPLPAAQPGDVIAQAHGQWGHSGIVVSLTPGRQTASVNTAAKPAGIITVNNWGFRPSGNGEKPGDPAPVVRRCTMGAQ